MEHQELIKLTEAYSIGALDEAEKERFESHLASGCHECRRLLADLHIVAAMIGEVGEIKPRPQVKEKLLKTIKPEAAETPFLSIRANEGDWKPIAPGVQVKILFTDRERRTMTMLMKMAAGSQLEEHRHHGAEELFVLEGDCFSAGQTLSAGDYHRAAPGSSHGVTSTKNGCLMLVISPLAA